MSDPAPRLRPFTGYLTTPLHADRVIGPPSALLTPEQKKAERKDPLNYRNTLGRRGGFDQRGALSWLQERVADGVVTPVDSVVLVYRHTRGEARSLGFIAEVSLDSYARGEVKKHEATIGRSQEKMVRYMSQTRVYGKPVTLTYRSQPETKQTLETYRQASPEIRLETVDGSTHDLWVIEGKRATDLCSSIDQDLYITDGHHRLAAATALAELEQRSDYMPAGLFATDELELGSFARCISDAKLDVDELRGQISARFSVRETTAAKAIPDRPGEVSARIGEVYLIIEIGTDEDDDPYDCLNTNRLHREILQPLLGVDNPSTDKRLEYVSSDSSYDSSDFDAWFLPHPESVDEVIAVADRGLSMPPKSTLFGPKLPSGLAIRMIDG